MNVGTETQRQWFKRPDDEKFASLEELHKHVLDRKMRSHAKATRILDVSFEVEDENLVMYDERHEVRAYPTNWAFSQVCAMVGAHASYLSELPAKLARECLNHGLQKNGQERNRELELLLVDGEDDTYGLSSVTSTGYGRVWDANQVRFAQELSELTNGRFYAPHDWGGVKRSLFAGDRDLHMLFIDGGSLVDGGGERDQLNRGFILGNSEVGSKAWYFATFLFRIVCGNFGIHGIEEVSFFSIKHTMNAPARVAAEALPHVMKYVESSPKRLEDTVKRAKLLVLPKDNREFFTYFRNRKFTGPEIEKGVVLADKEEGQHDTLWDMYNGFTAAARIIPNADVAASLQSRSGKLLEQLAA